MNLSNKCGKIFEKKIERLEMPTEKEVVIKEENKNHPTNNNLSEKEPLILIEKIEIVNNNI